ncbi:sulfate ABC transporter permease subunit [Paenibacillus chibensis]|uniref:Sulfate ABC transporter permease subunit n=2 Tax=Paenibacillus chibensis TaxID=59846 RepID=A0ABU6PXD1_9BACL|nr:sulfate ABC transporter permease subunit [Paenibacillus chibensis]
MNKLWITLTYAVFTVLLIIPLGKMTIAAFSGGLGELGSALSRPEALHAFMMTALVVVTVTLLNTLLGMMTAVYLVRGTWMSRGIRRLLNSIVDLPYAVSPVIGGLMIVLLLGPGSAAGTFFDSVGFKIVYAFPGMVIATLFVTFPFVARELIPLMEDQGQQEEEAAITLGAKGWTVFTRVTLPNIRWGLIYGIILCNARAMGEFGAVSVVSGHIRGETNTLPLHVEILYNEYQFSASFAVASLLLLLALATLLIKSFYARKNAH